MNDGGYVSKTGMAAAALWAVVIALLGSAWVVILAAEHHLEVAGMLAATGCATSALAATLHIKTYACRMSRLIRLSSGLELDDVPAARQLRPMR